MIKSLISNFYNDHKKDILVGFLFVFAVLTIFDVIIYKFEQKEYDRKVVEHKAVDGMILLNQLEKYYGDAEANADLYAGLIKANLIEFYGPNNFDILRKDLTDLKNRKVTSVHAMIIISNTIRNVTLNGVSGNAKDNNDLIIFLADLIIGDLSDNCATDAAIRTIFEEAYGTKDKPKLHQFNSELAVDAMNGITKLKLRRTYWHFLTPDNKYKKDVLSIKTANYETLKSMFELNGFDLEFLAGFEFLAVSRINNDDTDFFGTKLKDGKTLNPNHLQIHVVQGFNLKDQIEHDTQFMLLLSNRENVLKELEREKEYGEFKFTMSLLFLATVLSFLCGAVLKNLTLHLTDDK